MFQIENNGSWYWEIGDENNKLIFKLGRSLIIPFNHWSKKINPNDVFETVKVTNCHGTSLNNVIENITYYRRNITEKCPG
jgi:hypothetical protein